MSLEKSLPSEYYRSPEIFARERDRIFGREWFCAGRSDTLPEAGRVHVLEAHGESLLVARTAAGRLQAHYNVCRHRGARLCAADAEGPTLRCPYHAWKIVAENYNECYHCAGVHPELCEVVPAFKTNGGAGLDWDRGIPHRDGAFTFTRTGKT